MKNALSQQPKFAYLVIAALVLCTACMRVEPTHPYDPESPSIYRAPSSLMSALYSPDIIQEFDYSAFTVSLAAAQFDALYTRRAERSGRFRFDGVPPGVYYLSAEGEVEGERYEIIDEEVFLPVGEVLTRHFFEVKPAL